MRIISQDGRVDFPYNNVMVEIDPDTKCDILLTTPEMAAMGQAFTAAHYSTPEKAVKVMSQLHGAYKSVYVSGGKMTGHRQQFYAPEMRFEMPKVWKLPLDEEV